MSNIPRDIMGVVIGVQVGTPQKLITAKGRDWTSAIAKAPVEGKVALVGENLAGDYQANRKYHGGPDKAVCGYFATHYPAWQEEFGMVLPFGAFGENLTIATLTEDDLCIGDIVTVGTCRLQVSQPRQPCINVSRRWNVPRLPRRMEETGHTGFYCRVLTPGELAPQDLFTVTDRPCPDWSLTRANQIMYAALPDPDALAALRSLPPLSAEWKRILTRKLRP